MLPGIRTLLAAIVLSISILTFGLGAAAVLRAAHEEVASVPTRRVMPEPVFAQQAEPPAATLALLRVAPAEPEKAPDTALSAAPALEPAPEAVPVPKVEAEKLAAPKLDEVVPAETAKPEYAAKPEVAEKPETAATETPAPLPAAEPPPAAEAKLALLDAPTSPPVEAAPVAPAQSPTPATPTDASLDETKTAALGDPAAKIEKTAEAKKASEKAERDELRKKERAERAKERRRQAARRAKLAAQQAAAQQAANPFAPITQAAHPVQPATTASTAARRRQ